MNLISEQPAVAQGQPQMYWLRWRFDFAGRASKRGIWNAGGSEMDGAWCVKKDGLVRVAVEGQCIYTHNLVTLFELDGHEYACAEWDAYSKLPGFYKGDFAVKPRTFISGISLLTQTERIMIRVNGKVDRMTLAEYDRQFKNKREHSI